MIIYEKTLFPELGYIFKHTLTQDVAYNSLLLKRRRQLHKSIGNSIEDLYADRLEEQFEILSHHFSRSDDTEKAIKYLELAGDKAAKIFSNKEAKEYYEKAIDYFSFAADTTAAKEKLIDLYLKLIRVQRYIADFESNLQLMRYPEELSLEIDDGERLAGVYYWIGRIYYLQGDQVTATIYFRRCLNLAEKIKDDELIALPINVIGRAMYVLADFKNSIEYLKKGIELMERQGNIGEASLSYGVLGVSYSCIGEWNKAEENVEKSIRYARESKDPIRIASSLNNMGAIFFAMGDPNEGLEWCFKAREYLEDSTYFYQHINHSSIAMNYMKLGNNDEGLYYLNKAIQIANNNNINLGLPLMYTFKAYYYILIDDFDTALELIKTSENIAKQRSDPMAPALNKEILGIIEIRKNGEIEKAENYINKSINMFKKLGAKPSIAFVHYQVAEAYFEKGYLQQAKNHLEQAIPMYRTMKMQWDLNRAKRLLKKVQEQ